jgi:hypothetical protein
LPAICCSSPIPRRLQEKLIDIEVSPPPHLPLDAAFRRERR